MADAGPADTPNRGSHRPAGPGLTKTAADVNNMAEPSARANPLRALCQIDGDDDTYLVTQELHLALSQLFALVQLLNPLV